MNALAASLYNFFKFQIWQHKIMPVVAEIFHFVKFVWSAKLSNLGRILTLVAKIFHFLMQVDGRLTEQLKCHFVTHHHHNTEVSLKQNFVILE
jgi:hypothetical protein